MDALGSLFSLHTYMIVPPCRYMFVPTWMHWTRNSVCIPILSYLHVSTCSYLHGCIALVVKLVYLHFRLIRFSIEGGESHKSLVKLSASHLVVIFSIFSSFAPLSLTYITNHSLLSFSISALGSIFTLTLCYFLSCLVLLVFILNLFIYRPLSTLQIIPCYFNFYFGSRQHLLSLSHCVSFFLSCLVFYLPSS